MIWWMFDCWCVMHHLSIFAVFIPKTVSGWIHWAAGASGWGMSSCVKRGRGASCTWKLVKPWMVLWPKEVLLFLTPMMWIKMFTYVHIFKLRVHLLSSCSCNIIYNDKLYTTLYNYIFVVNGYTFNSPQPGSGIVGVSGVEPADFQAQLCIIPSESHHNP